MQVVKKSGASVFLGAFSFNSRIAPVLSYQAQLLPPPEQLMRTERVALHTILRIPNSCFRHVNFFELPKFGGPSLRTPYYACCAALFRTAVKTTPHWQKWMVQLREVQREVMPMAYVPRRLLCCPWWDNPPIVANLEEAYEGVPNNRYVREGGVALLEAIRSKNKGVIPKPGDSIWYGGSIQKEVYKILMDRCKDTSDIPKS